MYSVQGKRRDRSALDILIDKYHSCKETMNIDRAEFSEHNVLVCPLPKCGHKWCKCCLKALASSQDRHRCKNGNIERLMKRKGWKYCPGECIYDAQDSLQKRSKEKQFLRMQDTGSKRDGMQPYDGQYPPFIIISR